LDSIEENKNEEEKKEYIPKPILKWVGGKQSLLDEITPYFPKECDSYHEIFLGGGSVLIDVLSSKKMKINKNIYAYDLNKDLINFYNDLKNNPVELFNDLKILYENKNTEEFYYSVRDMYNEMTGTSTKKSAMFLYLNKTCFRGLHRIGPKGFNVPYGNYTNISRYL
jgi:DNA adenine methylase